MAILPRLFIASSTGAKTLAEQLALVLEESGDVQKAEVWTSEKLSGLLLDKLIASSKRCDLAVVILTGDDILKAKDGTEEIEVPRDNCVFELGLFIGAYGKPERCVLLSSLEPRVVFSQLSDIAGQLYVSLTLPANLENENQCRKVAEGHSKEILDVVKEQRRFSDRPRVAGLRIDDIFELEANKHRVKENELVLVKERSPHEIQLGYAKTVLDNMCRSVNYLYLFGSREGSFRKIVEMLRSLMAVEILEEGTYADYENANEESKKQFFTGQAERLEARIGTLRRRLFIELIDDVGFDEFCIHSAGEDHAVGWMKLDVSNDSRGPDERYVPMPRKAAELRFQYKAYKAKKKWPTQVIFDLTTLDESERKGVEYQIRHKFPEELHSPLISACFEPPPLVVLRELVEGRLTGASGGEAWTRTELQSALDLLKAFLAQGPRRG